jgi:hypothetical protein
MIRKFRDISIIEVNGKTLTVACDSCAGVGELDGDTVRAGGYITGYRTAFVPLAETLALGAAPTLVVNTLSVPMDEYGKELLRGIKDAAREAGLLDENAVTGSTEDNFAVQATALGVTVIGELASPLPSAIRREFGVYLAGVPKSGAEVLAAKKEILTFKAIKRIKSLNSVADFIPVGSKGIAYEISQMEQTLRAVFTPAHSLDLDMDKSAGPATCAIFAATEIPQDLTGGICTPMRKLGIIKPK